MQTATNHRELTQTAADGRTRTFSFHVALDGMVMQVDIRDPAGKSDLASSLSYHFTDAEFEQFRRLTEQAV